MWGLGGLLLTAGGGLPYVAGMQNYYSADNTTNSGGFATAIQDISGKNEASLTTVSGNPIYSPSDPLFNGKPSLSCVAAGRRVEVTLLYPIVQPFTIYMVLRHTATNPYSVYWRTNQGNFSNAAGFMVQTDNLPRLLTHDGSGNGILSSTALTTGNYVTCSVYDQAGATSAFYANNSQTANASTAGGAGSVDADTCNVITIGTFVGQSADYSWTSLISYSGSHDSSTRRSIMKALGSKYNIAVT